VSGDSGEGKEKGDEQGLFPFQTWWRLRQIFRVARREKRSLLLQISDE